MKTHPVWNVYWQNKTDNDKKDMLDKLDGTWGYDA